MSLINDALRKANRAQKKRPPRGPLGAPVQTVESLKRPGAPVAAIVGGAVGMTCLVVAVWAFAVWWKGRNQLELGQAGKAAEPMVLASAPEAAPQPDLPTPEAPAPKPPPKPSPAAATSVSTPAAGRPTAAPPELETAFRAPPPRAIPASAVMSTSRSLPAEPLNEPLRPDGAMTLSDLSPGAPTIAAKRPERPTDPVPPPTSHADKPQASAHSIPYSMPTPAPKPTGADAGAGQGGATGREIDFVKLEKAGPTRSEPESGFPELNLQGIFYRLKNPSVMINRRALYVGDEIAGAKVVEIQRRAVIMEKDGRRKTLSMGGF